MPDDLLYGPGGEPPSASSLEKEGLEKGPRAMEWHHEGGNGSLDGWQLRSVLDRYYMQNGELC